MRATFLSSQGAPPQDLGVPAQYPKPTCSSYLQAATQATTTPLCKLTLCLQNHFLLLETPRSRDGPLPCPHHAGD